MEKTEDKTGCMYEKLGKLFVHVKQVEAELVNCILVFRADWQVFGAGSLKSSENVFRGFYFSNLQLMWKINQKWRVLQGLSLLEQQTMRKHTHFLTSCTWPLCWWENVMIEVLVLFCFCCFWSVFSWCLLPATCERPLFIFGAFLYDLFTHRFPP